MTNYPTMASIKFDRFKFKSSRRTEFNMTCAVRRMDEIIVEVRQVYALALTITYRTKGRRILEIERPAEG